MQREVPNTSEQPDRATKRSNTQSATKSAKPSSTCGVPQSIDPPSAGSRRHNPHDWTVRPWSMMCLCRLLATWRLVMPSVITRRSNGGAALQDTRFVSFSVPQTPRPEQTIEGIRRTCWYALAFLFCAYEGVNGSSSATRSKPKNDGTWSTQDRPRSIIYLLADLPRVTSLLDWIGLMQLACRPLPLASGPHPQSRGGKREDLAPCSQPLCKHRHIPTWPHEVHHASMNASARPCHGFENMARPRAATADRVSRQRPC